MSNTTAPRTCEYQGCDQPAETDMGFCAKHQASFDKHLGRHENARKADQHRWEQR